MPFFMIQAAYNETGAAHLVAHPQRREEALAKACATLGGKLHSFFFSFGTFDAVVIAELPDNQAALAFALSVEARGAVRNVQTTPLLTSEEAVGAMKKAATDNYAPPA